MMSSGMNEHNTKTLEENLLACFSEIKRYNKDASSSESTDQLKDTRSNLIAMSCKEMHDNCLQDFNQVKEKLEEKCLTLLHNQRNVSSKKEETSAQITKYYSSLREQINQLLFNEERKFQNELKTMANNDETAMEKKVSDCRSLLKALEDNESVISHAESRSDEECSDLIIAFETLRTQLQTLESKVSDVQPSTDTKMFVPNKAREESALCSGYAEWQVQRNQICSESDAQTGHTIPDIALYPGEDADPRSPGPYRHKSLIEHEREAQIGSRGNDSTSENARDQNAYSYANQVSSFEITVPGDRRKAKVGGICWVRNRILATDRYNRKLKMFHENGEILFALKFPEGEPWDVTLGHDEDVVPVKSNSCFLTLPTKKQILRIRVFPDDKLELADRFRSQVGYSCITYNKSKANIICGCGSPFDMPRVDVISVKGDVIQSFALDAYNQPLFDFPRSVNISQDGVITICDWNKNRVLFLRSDGFILGTYRGARDAPLRDPRGTSLDQRGHLMIADGKSHNIHIVDLLGQFVACLRVDHPLDDPQEIDLTTNGQAKLAVSYRSQHIKVLHLS